MQHSIPLRDKEKPRRNLYQYLGDNTLKNIFVGNLSFSTSDTTVEELFQQHGEVHSVRLINDRDTGRPRGFGFVQMDKAGADSAIAALDGVELDGRNLKVNEALERKPRNPSW